MTTREKMEARAERRRQWAESRRAKAAPVAARSALYRGDHAFNTQPGHIPERARLIAAEDRAHQDLKMAARHEAKAAGIEAQAERAIFWDDDNAPEALEAKALQLDADADRWKALAAAWRKRKGEADPAGVLAAMRAEGLIDDAEARRAARDYALMPYHKTPWPSYHTTNLRANARRCRERAKDVRGRLERAAAAEAAGGVTVERHSKPCARPATGGTAAAGPGPPTSCPRLLRTLSRGRAPAAASRPKWATCTRSSAAARAASSR